MRSRSPVPPPSPAPVHHPIGSQAPSPVPPPAARTWRRSWAALAAGAVIAGMLGIGAAVPAHAATGDGLVLWYKLDDTSGSVAADSSGNGRNATVVGTASWGGVEGLALDGSTTYVKTPDSPMSGLTAITVATDVWIDPAQTTPYFLYGFGNTTSWYGDGYLFATGNAFRAGVASGNWSTEQVTASTHNLARGGWKHVAYTQTGNTAVLYEDGVEVARNTGVTITPASIGGGTTTANYLGRSTYPGDNLLRGRLRDFRMYDRALDAAEVAALATTASTQSLAAEKSALTLGDTSAVTADLALPSTGSLGGAITWATGNAGVVDATGKVTRPAYGTPNATATLTATIRHGTLTGTKAFDVTVLPLADDTSIATAAAAALVVRNIGDVRGNLTLSATANDTSTVSWASADPSVISATGEVTRPAYGRPDAVVTLTAAVTHGTATVTRDFSAKVPALPAAEKKTGYMFSYFTGEGSANGEQMYFALSKGNDPLNWRELNNGNPVLTSTLGEKGIRDPFITRSPEGDKFYLIATDLRIYQGNGWGAAQSNGSRSLAIWESTDLTHWSAERLIKVSPDTAGDTWAPEAFWDPSQKAYVVYWASTIFDAADTAHTGSTYNRMMYATTRDFWTFSPAKEWKNPGYAVIDATVTEHNGQYYRFTKDERNNTSSTPCSKFVMEEKSASLTSTDWGFVSDCIGKPDLSAGEGPTIFKANDADKWYLFVDEFGGRGYVPFSSTNLDSGAWTMEKTYSLPASPRHGTVMGVTQAEYERLLSAYLPTKVPASIADVTVDTTAGAAPVLPPTVSVTYADGSTGSAAVSWDPVPASAYTAPGTFTVLGSIADSGTVRARAVVTVMDAVPGLVLQYRFDEGGGTVARDSSGHGNNGSYVGSPTFGTGVKGGDVQLAGGASTTANPQYVTIPNGVLKGVNDITVSSWVKLNAPLNVNEWLFGLGPDNTTYLFVSPVYNSGQVLRSGITTSTWSGEFSAQAATGPAPGTWAHVAVTLDSTTGTETLYLNGNVVARTTGVTVRPSDLYDATKPYSGYIGRSLYGADPYLGGAIDDFRIYDQALSEAEVVRLSGNTGAIRTAAVAQQKVPPMVDDAHSTVTLPVKPDTDLTTLAPTFTVSPGATISPASGSTQDFGKPVTYTVTGSDGAVRSWTVKALIMRSPAIPGYYADPNIAVFGDTYWIYPTADGFDGWAGTQFHAFSSKDLVTWTDHGVVLDVAKNLSWASGHAWAPTITQKNGKYYLYFCADTNIGVAVADSPAGPFTDALGKPLVAAGFRTGQMIDPAVFTDDDGSSYLYWGNGRAYVVRLNPDLVSFDPAAVQDITPSGFNEGSFVIKRKGIYYLTWSENDTRDPNYQVAYAVGTSPSGPFTKQGVILSKDVPQGILGTGHHSIVQVPGTDDWYIAYHRFAIPGGDGMHRETTIDRLQFTSTNLIAPVVPTLTGVAGEPVPDLTAPVASVSFGPAAPATGWYRGGPVTVAVTGTDDRGGAVQAEVRITGPGFTGQWSPLSTSVELLTDGVYQVDGRVTDGSGNVSAVASGTVRIDGTAPVSKSAVDTTARTVTLTAADSASGVSRIEYSLDGGTTWRTYAAPVVVGRSAVTVSYRAVDVAGNVEGTNAVTVASTLAPTITTAYLTVPKVPYGKAASVSVRVIGGIAGVVPGGTVRVLNGAVEVGRGTLSGTGRATITLAPDIPVGRNTLVVRYDGHNRYDTSSATVTLTVLKSGSDTGLRLNTTRTRIGQPVTATVTVTPATRVPVTGTVVVHVIGGGLDLRYPATLDAKGTAVITFGPFVTRGTAQVFVEYTGSTTVEVSQSAKQRITIG
ncbi:MAG TPA: family 43 glycosylhydrolase [Kineosporiaceae bacterium]|nr:family 43 glycosylhydrolase [Kineosporiaceae bacterium]